MRFVKMNFMSLAISLGLSCTPVSAMEKEEKYHNALSNLSSKMETLVVQKKPQQNTIVCPMGGFQLLVDLHDIADEERKTEVSNILGLHPNFEGALSFVQTLPKNTPFVKETKKSRYKSKNKAYYNGHFILPSDRFVLNEEKSSRLKQLQAEIMPTDFSDPEKSADTVNNLVETNTNHLISNIISADAFEDPVALVLLSTLYMNSSWTDEFEEAYIPFRTPKDDDFNRMFKGFTGELALPFVQTYTQTTVLLKALGNTFLMINMHEDGHVSPIQNEHIHQFLEDMECSETIKFSMPEFTLENTLDLKELFKQDAPHLMNKGKFTIDLFEHLEEVKIGQFIQKNKLDVTRTGMEGASATIMTFFNECAMVSMEDCKKIEIDQPFSFRVLKKLDQGTWLTLFSGQVFEPIAPRK